jgi:hypothetical protein
MIRKRFIIVFLLTAIFSTSSLNVFEGLLRFPCQHICPATMRFRLSEVISASGDMLIWNMGYKNKFAETMII